MIARVDFVWSGASGAKIDPRNRVLGTILAPEAPDSLDSRKFVPMFDGGIKTMGRTVPFYSF